jgi:hypothetical protein
VSRVSATPGFTVAFVSVIDQVSLSDIVSQETLGLLFTTLAATTGAVRKVGRVRIVEQCGGLGVEMHATSFPIAIAYSHMTRVELCDTPGLVFPELAEAPFAGSGVFASLSEIEETDCGNLVKEALVYLQRHTARRLRWEHLLGMYVAILMRHSMRKMSVNY